MDTRELILQRLQACLKTLAPGVTFTMPFGETHRAIETDLGGRVYNRMRAGEKIDRASCPSAEVLHSPRKPDVITPHNDTFYQTVMHIEVWGYAYGTDAGDGVDSDVRPMLNALLADLRVGVEAFPYWTDATYTAALVNEIGPVIVMPTSQWTEPATDQPVGYLVIEYALTYSTNRLTP